MSGIYVANAAQFSAFLFHQLDDPNWAGLYLNRNEELVLGPFQGQIACVRILWAWRLRSGGSEQATQRVEDVHAFAGQYRL